MYIRPSKSVTCANHRWGSPSGCFRFHRLNHTMDYIVTDDVSITRLVNNKITFRDILGEEHSGGLGSVAVFLGTGWVWATSLR